ncbi:MAG: MBL fold metallo-hydrolase [Actinobacteria bacterium]|nr:MBL fold metallo-hydrolase [Actinomycetota bacterium]
MTRLHILGAGTPTPTAERFGSSYVVETGGQLLMVDCGPATTHKLVKEGLWPTDINALFFTHHHFDHDVDYPCFLLTRWDQGAGKEEPLRVYGPDYTEEITGRLIGPEGAFIHDIDARINFRGSQNVYVNRGGMLPRRPLVVHAQNIIAGWVHEAENWRVSTAQADHVQPYLDCLAYRVDTDDCSIVITGDSAPCDTVRDLAKGADVLVSMCWDHQSVMEREGEQLGQTGTVGAGELAASAGVRSLVLVHMGPNLSGPGARERALGEVRDVYDGEVFVSEEVSSLDFARRS